MKYERLSLIARFALPYILVGGLWILLSDRIVAALVKDLEVLTTIQTFKGWLFVIGSALALGFFVARERRTRETSEHYVNNIFEHALEGIYQSTLEGRYIRLNPAMALIYGYSSSEEMLSAITDIGRQLHVEPMMFEQLSNNVLRNGFVEKFEARNYRRDGAIIWTSTSAQLVRDADGKPSYFEGFVRNITHRKASEIVLQEHEQQYRMLFESAPIGIAVVDLEGRILTFNDAILEPGGYKREEIEKLGSAESLYANQGDGVKLVEMLRETKPIVKEHVQFKRKDGSAYEALLTLVPIQYDGHPCVQALVEDISSQRRIERSLLEEQTRFRVLIENSIDGTSLYSADGNILYQSPAITRILGYEPGEVYGANTAAYVHPDDVDKLRRAFAEVLRAPSHVVTTEIRFRHKNGAFLWLEVILSNQLDEPAIQAMVGNYRDITRRKIVEDELRESEEQYRRLVEHSPYAVAVHSQGLLVYVNKAGVQLIGARSAEELIGTPIMEFVHPDSRPEVAKRFKQMQAGESVPALEETFIRRDGSTIPVEATAYPCVYGNQPAMQVVIRDLTMQKQAEEALRTNEERLRGIVDHTPNIYYSHTPDHILTYMSAQTANILGYQPDELKGKWQDLLTDHPVNQRGIELTEKAIETGIEQEPYIMELKAKDGKHIWVEVRETPVVREGKTVAVVGALTDITHRKQADESLERHLAELTVLHAVALAGSQSYSEDEVIKRSTQIISGMLYPDNCGVLLLNAAGTALIPDRSYWGANFGSTFQELDLSIGITGQVAATGKPARVNDVLKNASYVEATSGIQSELCVPILVNEKVIGVFNVESRKINAFDEEDERVLTTIAGTLGTAIERIRLLVTEMNRRLEAEHLREATAALTSSIELEQLYETILDAMSKLVSYTSASIELIDHDVAEIVAARGLPENYNFAGRRYTVELGKWGNDLRSPIIVPDVQLDERFEKFPGTEYIRGWVGIPMIVRDKLVGYLNLDSDKVGFYDEAQVATLQIFANQAAIALENARVFQEERRRTQIIEAMAEIANEIATTQEMGPLLDKVSQRALDLLKASHVAIYIVQNDNKTVKVVSARGTYTKQLMSHVIKIGEGITGSIIASGKSEIINDTRLDPRTVTVPGTPLEDGLLETMMSSPLILRGKAIGAINAWRLRSAGLFNQSELNFLINIAHQTSISIELSRLFQESSRRAQEAAAIAEVGRDISSTLQVDIVLERIAAYAQDLLRAETSAVYLYDPNDFKLRAIAAAGVDAQEIKNDPLELGRGIGGHIALHKRGEIVNYAAFDPRAITVKGTEMNSTEHFMGVPVLTNEHLTGLLVVWRTGSEMEFIPSELIFLSSLAQQAAVAIENARLFELERHRRQEAENLQVAATAVTSSLDVEEVLQTILIALKQVAPYDSASMLLLEDDQVRIRAAKGLPHPDLALNQLFPASNPLLRAIQESGKAVIIHDAQEDSRFERWAAADNVHGWLGVPLIARGKIIGYITLDSYIAGAFDVGHAALAQTFAHQAAAAIENARLFASLEQTNEELSKAYDTTLEGWGKALELRDKETQGHTKRVAELTLRLARQIGLPEPELTHIRRGVLVHDIGKMGIPDRILHKKGTLTKKDWEQLHKHPQYAFDLLYPIAYLRPALDIAYCHHEHWDGTGYPRELSGEEIPLSARIFAVVDVWDALLSDRAYRRAWPKKKVLKYIHDQAGVQFDPHIVKVFLKMIS